MHKIQSLNYVLKKKNKIKNILKKKKEFNKLYFYVGISLLILP